MYELIKKRVTEEIKKQTKETKELFGVDGYEFVLNRYLTDLRIKQLKESKITLDKAIEIATKKLEKEDAKRLENKLKHIEEIEKAELPNEISVSVEWAKNRTWGFNPHARVWANYKWTSDTASGCGYDKESSAIAGAFNQNNSILKILYEKFEKELQKDYNIKPNDAIGYGAGYGATPYFEGGVGVGCFIRILKDNGFIATESHGKHYDCYNFTIA